MPSQKAMTADSEFPPLEKGKLRLYSMRFCPFAQRTRILLAHKNIEYETVNINLKSKPEWYLKDINPLGLVPALQKDDTVVYDSRICNAYLEDAYPGEGTIPTDPYDKAKDDMLMEHFPKMSGSFYKGIRSGEWKEAAEDFKKGLAIFEKELEKRKSPFFGGNKPMNVDFLLWPHFERVEALKNMVKEFAITAEEFPLMNRWVGLITEVPAVKETMFSPEVHMELWKNMKAGIYNYDLGLEE